MKLCYLEKEMQEFIHIYISFLWEGEYLVFNDLIKLATIGRIIMLGHFESQVPNLTVGHLSTHMTICMPQQSRKPKRTLSLDQSQDLRTKTPGKRKTFSGCIDDSAKFQTD